MSVPVVDYESRTLLVDDIVVLDGRRQIREEAVTSLVSSIVKLGLRTPITVRRVDDHTDESGEVGRAYVLVTGAHRLAAYKYIGERYIPCVVRDCTETDARKWEISENLHRADLTALERSEQAAEWIDLVDRELISFQVETKSKSESNPRGSGRKESGVNAASRELGISQAAAHRSKKIAAIQSEAKSVAIDVGLADNQRALLAIAAGKTADEQVSIAHSEAAARAKPRSTPTSSPNITNSIAETIAAAQQANSAKDTARTAARAAWSTFIGALTVLDADEQRELIESLPRPELAAPLVAMSKAAA